MITTTNKQNPEVDTTKDVHANAMLMALTVRAWSARKFDKTLSDEVTSSHYAHEGMARVNKRLLDKDCKELSEVIKIGNQARQEHYKLTLPWLDNGARMLPSNLYMRYCATMSKIRDDHDDAVSKLIDVYADQVEQSLLKGGSLFDRSEFPAPSEIKSKFEISFMALPLPSAQDFRVNLSANETSKIKQDIQRTMDRALDDTVKHLFRQIKESLTHMSDRLHSYGTITTQDNDTEGTGKGHKSTFRDTLIENMRSMVELLPALNLTDNAEINDFASAMRKDLCLYSAEQLRGNADLRQETAMKADQILAKLSDYI